MLTAICRMDCSISERTDTSALSTTSRQAWGRPRSDSVLRDQRHGGMWVCDGVGQICTSVLSAQDYCIGQTDMHIGQVATRRASCRPQGGSVLAHLTGPLLPAAALRRASTFASTSCAVRASRVAMDGCKHAASSMSHQEMFSHLWPLDLLPCEVGMFHSRRALARGLARHALNAACSMAGVSSRS